MYGFKTSLTGIAHFRLIIITKLAMSVRWAWNALNCEVWTREEKWSRTVISFEFRSLETCKNLIDDQWGLFVNHLIAKLADRPLVNTFQSSTTKTRTTTKHWLINQGLARCRCLSLTTIWWKIKKSSLTLHAFLICLKILYPVPFPFVTRLDVF